MKRIILATLAALALLVPSVGAGPTFPLEKVLPSVAKLEMSDGSGGGGHCTAFSINWKTSTYMTAGHCLEAGYLYSIDGKPALALHDDDQEDLGIVRGGRGRAPLKMAKGVKLGELVAGVGYGLDTPAPLIQAGYVISLFLDPYGVGMDRLILSTGLIPGMSGGPIVNTDGKLVSVVQMTGYPNDWYQNIGAGGLYSKVRELYEQYR